MNFKDYINTFYIPEPAHFFEEYRYIAEKNSEPIILRHTRQFIMQMLILKKPSKILELGTNIGYSASVMSYTLRKIVKKRKFKILTIEADSERCKFAEKMIKKYKLPHIKIINRRIENILPLFRKEYFDFIFVDADKLHYEYYLNVCVNILKYDGIIIFDNVFFKESVFKKNNYSPQEKVPLYLKSFNSYFMNVKNLLPNLLYVGDGLAVAIKKKLD